MILSKKVIALGGELHADEEAFLMEKGAQQANLWGINLYPDVDMPDMLEFDSMINIRPSQGNKTRGVESEEIRNKITEIVSMLITD